MIAWRDNSVPEPIDHAVRGNRDITVCGKAADKRDGWSSGQTSISCEKCIRVLLAERQTSEAPSLPSVLGITKKRYPTEEQSRKYRQQRYVYFIQAGTNGPIKIGVAAEPVKRMGELQTGSAERLRILAVVEGDQRHEKALHNRFEAHRLEGEWFSPAPVLQMLKALRSGEVDAIDRPFSRKLVCEVCDEEIKLIKSGFGGHSYDGMVSWLTNGNGAVDFRLHHKNSGGHHCDIDDDDDRLRGWMELGVAVGPCGLAQLIKFMTEPDTDRESLQLLIHRLYFTDGELDPPVSAFNRNLLNHLWWKL